MKGLLRLLLLLALATKEGRAQSEASQNARIRPYDACMKSAETNMDFGDCGEKEIARLERLLSVTWKKTFAEFTSDPSDKSMLESKKLLLDEQRAWIRYKDESCLHWTSGHGREGQVIHFYSCRASILEERISYLRDLLDDIYDETHSG